MRAFVSPLAFVVALLGVSPAWAEAPAPTYPPAAVGVGAHPPVHGPGIDMPEPIVQGDACAA